MFASCRSVIGTVLHPTRYFPPSPALLQHVNSRFVTNSQAFRRALHCQVVLARAWNESVTTHTNPQ